MNKIQKRWLFGLVTLGLFIGQIPTLITQSAPYPFYTIPEIQGDSWSTPYPWTYIQTTGIVTADFQAEDKRGFFLQDPLGDSDSSTSDGIFVYERYNQVTVGDEIIIEGRAREYYGLTEIDYVQTITILSTGNPLPMPIELDPPFDDYASDVYYERLESMLVSVSNMRVVAGTNQYGEFAGVRKDLRISRVFQDDPAGTGELIFGDDGGGVVVNVRTGYLIKGLVGPLDYTFDEYKVLPSKDAPPKVIPKRSGIGLGRGRAVRRDHSLTIATYNMFNFFDEYDNVSTEDTVYSPEEVTWQLAKHARAIHDYLREPDLIAVQEVETEDLLLRLAGTSPIKAEYGARLIMGPDDRGISVGLLYRTDRVAILSAEACNTETDLEDGFGPIVDPNLLFSRPPLVVHLEILDKKPDKWKWKGHHDHDWDDDVRKPMDLWLIINHFKSKYEGDWITNPRRVEQAKHVLTLVTEIQENDPNAKVVVLGDLNDFENRPPLITLMDGGLSDLIFEVKKQNRYTYIYNGVSEVLDHMLVTPSLEEAVEEVRVIHFNPDFPYPQYRYDSSTGIWSSDHDVLMTLFDLDELADHHDHHHD